MASQPFVLREQNTLDPLQHTELRITWFALADLEARTSAYAPLSWYWICTPIINTVAQLGVAPA